MTLMRRALSLFLLLFFGLGPLTTALEASDDSRLPACCRRHGTHHCAMSGATIARMVEATRGKAFLAAPSHCPLYPGNTDTTIAPVHALAPSPANQLFFLAQFHTPTAISA